MITLIFHSGKERNLNIVEVACSNCGKFFHESCIGYQMGKLLSFSMNYSFCCKFCSPTGLETYRRNSATLPQMCVTTIANLQRIAQKDRASKFMFSKDSEIIPFMDNYWESLTTLARKQSPTWHLQILKSLQAHPQLFTCQEENGDLLFGLVNQDLEAIKPTYESTKLNQNNDGE
jgi:Set1/Ash2 histone methyltransferase complex subunit ASH2